MRAQVNIHNKINNWTANLNEIYLFYRWEFRTFDHDIRFGIKRINDKTNEENIEIDLRRVASHQLDEEGFINCQPEWTCK